MINRLALLLVFVVSVGIADAANYYIRNSGSDSASCLSGAECVSPNKLLSGTPLLAVGDTLNARCGETHRVTGSATLTTPTAGTSTNVITLQGYDSCFEIAGKQHAGSANSSTLVVPNTNFSTSGVVAGQLVLNLTDGSYWVVTSISTTTTTNDTLNFSEGGFNGKENDWDVGDFFYVNNYPIITQASLFNSSWTNVSGNIWRHAATNNPFRQVFYNQVTLPAYYRTCTSEANAISVLTTDKHFCWTGSNLYVNSSSNPATRFTRPGVEVVSNFANGVNLLRAQKNYWAFNTVNFRMAAGWLVIGSTSGSVGASGLTFSNGIYSWAQLLPGSGAACIALGLNTATSDNTVRGVVFANCDRNGLNLSGTGTRTNYTIEDSVFINTFHSGLNIGHVGPATNVNLLVRNNTFLHQCIGLHSGNYTSIFTDTLLERLYFDEGVNVGDPRIFNPTGGCGSISGGILWQDKGTVTLRNAVLVRYGDGIRVGKAAQFTVDRSVISLNTASGWRALPASTLTLTMTANESTFTDNGTSGTTSPTNTQVGCLGASVGCANVVFSGTENIFRKPGGGAHIASQDDGDTAMTLAEFRTAFGGSHNAVSQDVAPAFVAPTANPPNFSRTVYDEGSVVTPYTGTAREIGLEALVAATPTVVDSTHTDIPWGSIYGAVLSACTAADFEVNIASGGYVAVSAVEIIGLISRVTHGTVLAGQTVLTKAAQGACTARAAGSPYAFVNVDSKSFLDVAATNNLPATAPTLSTCVVSDAMKDKVRLTIDAKGVPPLLPSAGCTGFTCRTDTDATPDNWVVSSCSRVADDQIELDMATDAVASDGLDCSYSQAGGNVTNSAGVELAAFTNTACTNNVGVAPPTFVSAVVNNAAPSDVVLTFSSPASIPMLPVSGATGITCRTDTDTTPDNWVVNSCDRTANEQFTCHMATAAVAADGLDCSYSQAGGNITSNGGTELTAFTNQVVTNQVQSGTGVLTATHYRCEMPFLTEANATLHGSDDTACNVVPGSEFALRVEVCCTMGACNGTAFKFFSNRNSGTFAEVTRDFGSEWVRFITNQNAANLTATAQRLSASTFVAGALYTAPGDFPTLNLASGECSEFRLHGVLSPVAATSQYAEIKLDTQTGTGVVQAVGLGRVNVYVGGGAW